MKLLKDALETDLHILGCSSKKFENYINDPSFAQLTKLQQKYCKDIYSNLLESVKSLNSLIKDMSKPKDETIYHIRVQMTGWNSRLNCWDSFRESHIKGTIDQLQDELSHDYWHLLSSEEIYKAKKISQILTLFKKRKKLEQIKSGDFSVKYKYILDGNTSN